jgi:hypothetical protein
MFYAYLDPDGKCLVCGEPTDREDIVDHWKLGPCCYGCACWEDFPQDLDPMGSDS